MACRNKFRTSTDLGHMLCRYWQLMEGKFIPKKDQSKYFIYLDNNEVRIPNVEFKVFC